VPVVAERTVAASEPEKIERTTVKMTDRRKMVAKRKNAIRRLIITRHAA